MNTALTHGQQGASETEKLIGPLGVQDRIIGKAEATAVETRSQLFGALTSLRRLTLLFEKGANHAADVLVPQANDTLAKFDATKTAATSGIENMNRAYGTDKAGEILAAAGRADIAESIEATASAVQQVRDNGQQAAVEFAASHTSTDEMIEQLDSLMTAFDGLARNISSIGVGPDKDTSVTNAGLVAKATERGTEALASISLLEEELSKGPLFMELRYKAREES